MLFDLEDYATTMRAMTDHLRNLNHNFNLGLDLPNPSGSEGFFIPTADLLLEINQELKQKQPKEINGVIVGGPEGARGVGLDLYYDFQTTANATKGAFVKAITDYQIISRRTTSNFNEIKTRSSILNEFLDANITLAEKSSIFWFALCSFNFYGQGFTEGDILSESIHGSGSNWNWVSGPVKFTILTQTIYDEYFTALTNFMQKVKAIMVLHGLEA
jgi:hypothetical protein